MSLQLFAAKVLPNHKAIVAFRIYEELWAENTYGEGLANLAYDDTPPYVPPETDDGLTNSDHQIQVGRKFRCERIHKSYR